MCFKTEPRLLVRGGRVAVLDRRTTGWAITVVSRPDYCAGGIGAGDRASGSVPGALLMVRFLVENPRLLAYCALQ